MCGRFGIEPDLPLQVEEEFNISFQCDADSNICPSMLLPTIINTKQGLQQFNGAWGIKPNWSKKLLINAKSETATIKPTFKNSVEHYRCIIPMSYWYEWCFVDGKKIKHQFRAIDNKPLYMAGIYYPTSQNKANIVSLTTSPTDQCKAYHHRMPLLVNKKWIETADVTSLSQKRFNITVST